MLGYNKIFADTFDRHFFNKLFFSIKTQAHFFGTFFAIPIFFLKLFTALRFHALKYNEIC